MEFAPKLTDEHLVFLVETIALGYVSLKKDEYKNWDCLPKRFLIARTEENLKETLRALLRVPLRDQDFRTAFNKHFESHPHPHVMEAWPWLSETLSWDSE